MIKLQSFLLKSIKWIYSAVFIGVVIICIFLNDQDYICKKYFTHSNFYYLFVGLISIGLLYFFLKLLNIKIIVKYSDILNKIMALLSFIFCVCLLIITYHYYFITGWDVEVVFNGAEMIVNHEIGLYENAYLSIYPNNLLLTCIFADIIQFGNILGMQNNYFSLIIVQCFIYSYSSYLVYRITDMIINNKLFAIFSWILYIALIGISPWVTIPYSDSFGLFFPVTIIYMLLRIRRKEHVLIYTFGLGLMSYIGFKIKPQILILFIAMGIILLLNFNKFFKENKKLAIICLTIALSGVVVSFLFVNIATDKSEITINSDNSLGFPHFLMMGFNEKTNGVFSNEDVELSTSISNAKERTNVNFSMVKNRIKEMGLLGLAHHFIKKILVVYNDGSFAWYAEGGFFQESFDNGYRPLQLKLKNYYYMEGENYSYFLSFMQTLWISTLFLSLFTVFYKRCSTLLVMKLALLGLTLYELLFEARARYLLIYGPIYVIMACIGFYSVLSLINSLNKKS